jgi:signal transduction histidine kinase/ligand-binding sensor domain-containing protein
MRKFLLFILVSMVIGAGLSSCKNTSVNDDQLPKTGFKPPVTVPLIFSKPKKINWDAIKSNRVHPVVKKFDMAKLPVQPYDESGLKPLKYAVEETRFDYNSLPEKDFDIDKIPSKPLKFITYILPPPKLIGSGQPHLKDTTLSLFELGEAQGLGGKIVTCLFKDRDGFLWIGCTDGIYRYDGENLLLYIPAEHADIYHYVLRMLQDRDGRIWITMQRGGLELLDPIAGTLKKTNMALGLGSDSPFEIIQDKQQRIWISANSPGGVNIIDPKTQTVKWLDKACGLSDTTQSAGIIMDNSEKIWVGSWKGLDVIDLLHKKIRYFNKSYGLKSDSVDKLLFDPCGDIYIGLHGGIINILHPQKKTLQTIKEAQYPGADLYAMLKDSLGKIWAGTTNNGLEIIDLEKNSARNLKTNDGIAGNYIVDLEQDDRSQVWIAAQLGLNMIGNKGAVIAHIGNAPTTTLAEDRMGLVWQGSFYHGVNIIDRKTKSIKTFNASRGLGNDTINFIKEVNNRIFISTSSGLDIIDSLRNTITHLGKGQGLTNTTIAALIVDSDGKVWIGGRENGIDIYDPKNNTFKNLDKMIGLSDNDAEDITEDLKGRIWVSTENAGIDEIDPSTGYIWHLNNESLKGADQRSLLTDNTHNIWIGTNNGIYIADVKNQTLTSFSTPQGLIDRGVISLLNRNNHVYAGTAKGISIITPPIRGMSDNQNWKVESFGKFYALKKVEVGYETDLVTKDGLYWWGDKGITMLDLSKKDPYVPPAYITAINIMDQATFFNGRKYTASKGMAWDKVAGPFNMPVNLQLPYNQNYLRFNYGSINLANHDTTWYRCKLAGVDKDWSQQAILTASRNYFNIPPGNYAFEVITKSSDAGWSKPAVLNFTINPPWWQTWWAYTLYIFLFTGSIWGFSHYRSLQLIKEKRILEHKVHVRTEEVMHQKEEIESQRDNLEVQRNSLENTLKELKSTQNQLIQSEKMASLGELTAGIAHEIQNPLNFVNNFSEVSVELLDELKAEVKAGNNEEVIAIADDLSQNLGKINHHGKRADSIVKGMLEHSRSGRGQKEPTDINVMADEFMRLSYHGLRSKDKTFNSDLITYFDPDLQKISVIQQDIGRVLLNLFNNAFYATNQKAKTAGAAYKPEVTVYTAFEGGHVVIKVKDNGVGIPDAIKEKIMQPFFTTKPAGEGTGLGLSLSYDMVVKGHGGNIKVESKEGEGSEFIISLPV